MLFEIRLTRVINLAIQLLSIGSLKHDFFLHEVLHSSLHQSILSWRAILAIINCGRLIILHQKLLLDVLWKEWLFVQGSLNLFVLLVSGYHVHFGHMSNYVRVVCNFLLAIGNDCSSTILFLNPINCHNLLRNLSLICSVLLKRIRSSIVIYKTCFTILKRRLLFFLRYNFVWIHRSSLHLRVSCPTSQIVYDTAEIELCQTDRVLFGVNWALRHFVHTLVIT